MEYNLIDYSLFFYRNNGFNYVESPWVVDHDISEITKPKEKKDYYIHEQCLVGSGEQSLLQLIKNGSISKYGKYVTTTPCFRDDDIDELHRRYFLKTELMIYGDLNDLKGKYQELINLCKTFFEKFTSVIIENKSLNIPDTYYDDIIDLKTGIELGSYGITTKTINGIIISWIYGTGCAMPRLGQVVNKNKKYGYHNTIIPRSIVGSFDKILEEVEELKDAILSKNKIMELVEISDLYGAIELYLKKNHPNISMTDIDIMNKTTQKAFLNGRR